MAREIPEVVRAAAGLAATVVDEARKLPETLPGLPVRVIGRAMQHAMKVQQTYAGFVARGDELFTVFRGDDEPGLATFDDDEPLPASTGFRESAFDRADDIEPTSAIADLIVDEEIALEELAEDPAADAVVDAAVEDVAAAPDAHEILDEIAIDELVDQAPAEATAPATSNADSQAPGPAPVDGYDSLTIAQLRGRLRGYVLSTVSDLLAYEQATRAREPYVRMLRNRLEKLEEEAVESSPLAPRGV